MKSIYIALALLAASVGPALAGPYRTVIVKGTNDTLTDFLLRVPAGKAIQIINFVAAQPATIYVGPFNSVSVTDFVKIMSADTDASKAVAKNVIVASKSTETTTGAATNVDLKIVVDVTIGDIGILTYSILGN